MDKLNNGTFSHVAASVRASASDLNALSTIDIPSSARLLLIAARANSNIILTMLDYAHAELGDGRHLSADFFNDIAAATIKDERKIRDYIAARPIGQTPLSGHH